MASSTATAAGILTSNTAEDNATAYLAWRQPGVAYNQELLFDVAGTYQFPAETLDLQQGCTLRGVNGVTLECTTSGEWFVAPRYGYCNTFHLENLTLDGGGLVDYIVRSDGSGVPKPAPILLGVNMTDAVVACFSGYNVYCSLRDCATSVAPVGFLFESCSESIAFNLVANSHTDACIRIVGILDEFALPAEDRTQTNGGRMSLFGVRCNVQGDFGVDLKGVGQTDLHGVTIEGASDTALRIRSQSSNIRVYGYRSNAGKAVVFDGCFNCAVDGGCVSTQRVQHLNGAYGCVAKLLAEDHRAAYDIEQDWVTGGATWTGKVRLDGSVVGVTSGQPTAGTWPAGSRVEQHVCVTGGSPGVWGATDGEFSGGVNQSAKAAYAKIRDDDPYRIVTVEMLRAFLSDLDQATD